MSSLTLSELHKLYSKNITDTRHSFLLFIEIDSDFRLGGVSDLWRIYGLWPS